MAGNTFNTVMFPADVAGCGFYRMKFPVMALQTIARNVRVIDSMKLIADPQFFRDIRVVRLQRQVSDQQADYFLNFLKPLQEAIGFWIVYEIDDVIGFEDIPPYNIGRMAFNQETFFGNIQTMLQASDFVTVTTDALKKYYVDKYEVDESKFIVMPNYLPRWWAGESYNLEDIVRRYDKNKNKPRILFPASSSHFDLKGLNNHTDDFTHIVPFILQNHNKYQFVFMGGYPKQIEPLVQQKRVEVHRGSDLLNYPREIYEKDIQLIIAPLQDNIFNRCKSNIKLLEGYALGIPVFAQDLPTYSDYTKMTFTNAVDLEQKVADFFKQGKEKFKKVVKNNRHFVDYGDSRFPDGWWLEKNLQQWYDIFAIPQRTLEIDLDKHSVIQEENEVKLEL